MRHRELMCAVALSLPSAAFACATGEVTVEVWNKTTTSVDTLQLAAIGTTSWGANLLVSSVPPDGTTTICAVAGAYAVRAADTATSVEWIAPAAPVDGDAPLVLVGD